MAFSAPLNSGKNSVSGLTSFPVPGTGSTAGSFNCAPGSTLIVTLNDAAGNNVSSITTNKGDTLSLIGAQTAFGCRLWVYGKSNCVGGTGCVITVTMTGSADASADYEEWPSSTIDASSLVTSNGGTNPYSTTTNTLASASSVVLLKTGCDAGGTLSYLETTGFTKDREETDGNTYWTHASFYKVVAATTAVGSSLNITIGGSGAGSAARVIFALTEVSTGQSVS